MTTMAGPAAATPTSLGEHIDRAYVEREISRRRAERLTPFLRSGLRRAGRPTVSWVGDLQQGDGGKGAMTDRLAALHQVVVRVQGGDNAGHTSVFRRPDGVEVTIKNHLLPSGLRHPGVVGVLGNGVLVNAERFESELRELAEAGIDLTDRVYVSDRAHLVLPLHVEVDGLQEAGRHARAIGTTRRGIGPANVGKVNRIGVRVKDLADPVVVRDRILANVRFFGLPDDVVEENVRWVERHAPVLLDRAIDSARVVNDLVAEGCSVLFEGAQGPLIDLEHGIYPYVTTSPTAVYSVASGGGLDVSLLTQRIGVLKVYQTMVGNGAFVSEDHGELGARLRVAGDEFGTTTGRDRRCGWLDLVQARWAVEVNGFTSVVLTKLDVLDTFERVGLCVAYARDGEVVVEFDADHGTLERSTPLSVEVDGWLSDTTGARTFDELPVKAQELCRRIESHLGVEVGAVTVGPRDTDMLVVPGSRFAQWMADR
ncbi:MULTISPECIES: adenylosuccinate synthetase [Cellulosimicrobium]|uniref:adenylosuccinate synthetase n=1 Tax=Cellulosimicrobium TaxID=157920 RepID=UPI0011A3C9BC|nr:MULTISPECIES: adenylosuccinate synthetase [Cellulosimicrobium]MBE9938047.1 adenylosuccinate synthetase [Cellulosimicrobium cellulans]